MPIFERPPIETLALAKDRWTPIYLEHGRLDAFGLTPNHDNNMPRLHAEAWADQKTPPGNRPAQQEQNVNMIRHAAGLQGWGFEIIQDADQVSVQTRANFRTDRRFTVFVAAITLTSKSAQANTGSAGCGGNEEPSREATLEN